GVLGDVVGHRERAERTGALGVHPALRDHLAVEVGELLQEPHVLQQQRPPRTSGEAVLVVDDGGAGSGGRRVGVVRDVHGHWLLLGVWWWFSKARRRPGRRSVPRHSRRGPTFHAFWNGSRFSAGRSPAVPA